MTAILPNPAGAPEAASPPLPRPRGPLSAYLVARLRDDPGPLDDAPEPPDGPLDGEDAPLSLYVLYELHYRSFADVHDGWEWDPSLIGLRGRLEAAFEARLRDVVAAPVPEGDVASQILALVDADDGPSLSRRLARARHARGVRASSWSTAPSYHLKEADPHTWAIPRLPGRAKAALVEIQADEYGGGRPEWMHAELFARTMRAARPGRPLRRLHRPDPGGDPRHGRT